MFQWEVQIARNPALHRKDRYALPTAVLLRDRMDLRTGKADVSQLWLSRALGIPPRSVVRAIGHLVEAGHLCVVPGRHRRSGNQYEPVLKTTSDGETEASISDTGVSLSGDGYRTPASHKPVSKKRRYVTPATAICDAGGKDIGHGRPHDSSSSIIFDSSVVPPTPKHSRKITKKITVTKAHEAVAHEITRWLGPKIGRQYLQRQWAREIAELEADGVAPEFVLCAFRRRSIEEKLPAALTTVKYFEHLAIEVRDEIAQRGDRFVLEWTEFVFKKTKGIVSADSLSPRPFNEHDDAKKNDRWNRCAMGLRR